MSDDRRNEGGGAIVAIILVIVVIGLLGVVGVGAGGYYFYRLEAREAEMRAMAEAEMAHMQAVLARAEAEQTVAKAHAGAAPITTDPVPTEEVHLHIDAAGAFTLENNPVKDDDLKAALKQAKAVHPGGVTLKIQAHGKAPFARIEQAMTAGTAAGITHQIVEQKSLEQK